MSDVELRELRYFVAVAEELNFSRAAERLGMAQPPLSKAIAQLESRLGVPLLERTTRQVSLTPAGEVLLAEARPVLVAARAAVQRAVRAGRIEPGLTVAVKAGGDDTLLREILASYGGKAEPLVTGWGGPADRVRDGSADVALVRSPYDEHGLDSDVLLSEARVAALAQDHKLAAHARLRRADLAGEPVPHWPDATPAAAAYWTGRDQASLRLEPPPRGPAVGDLAQLLAVVALGQAVAFLPESLAKAHHRAGVAYVPVTDLSPSVLAVVWPEGSRSPEIAAFVRAAAQTTQDRPELLRSS